MGNLRSQSWDEMQDFYFSRPVPAPEFEKMLLEERQLEITAESGRTAGGTLLIVDDEADVITALERILPGFNRKPDGECRAMAHLASHIFDLRQVIGTCFLVLAASSIGPKAGAPVHPAKLKWRWL